MKTIAYLVYGNHPEYHLELTYSVLSAKHFLLKTQSDIRIVLVTQEAARRDDLPVEHVFFTEADLDRWTGNRTYFHAAKVHALSHVLAHSNGPVVLIDTDTCFKRSPSLLFERIGPGRSLMHEQEGTLAHYAIWKPFLETLSRPLAGYTIDSASKMLNSGVVGVDQSDRSLLADVTALLNEMTSTHDIFNAEQFSFSKVLSTHTKVQVCPDVVWHYWGYDRPFCHAQISDLFPDYGRSRFERHVDSLPPIGMPKKRITDQLRARIKQWTRRMDPQYRFAYLAYLSAQSNRNPKIATIWASIALDILKAIRPDHEIVRRDFPALEAMLND